jgi:O-antigen ligase
VFKQINKSWIYIGAIAFILLNTLFIYREFYYLNIIPVVLLFIAAALLSLDKLILAIVFFVPLSVPLSELVSELPIDMFLPTEPLLAGILLIFTLKLIYEGNFDKKILLHPVTIAIYFYLTWILITSITSTMPVVSIKFLVSKLWFIVAFYFLTTQIFRNKKNIPLYFSLYTYSLILVVGYTLYRDITFGIFEPKIAYWASNPFYKDHTSYGAMLAFYIPPVISLIFSKENTPAKKFRFIIIFFILFTGLIFSYSRAAWMSLVMASGLWVVVKLKIKPYIIILFSAILIIFAALLGPGIMRDLKSNKEASNTNNITQHLQSAANVSTDASNLERINRWHCAIRMFKQKPVFGWGPGTYMFQYAPFQISNEKTIISTNEGNLGNTHSEYLGPLAEQGFLGTLFFIVIIITTIVTSIRVYKKTVNKQLRNYGLAAILGLITYYIHGFLNNFLDTDKASVPFWGFTAILVVLDVYYSNKHNSIDKKI